MLLNPKLMSLSSLPAAVIGEILNIEPAKAKQVLIGRIIKTNTMGMPTRTIRPSGPALVAASGRSSSRRGGFDEILFTNQNVENAIAKLELSIPGITRRTHPNGKIGLYATHFLRPPKMVRNHNRLIYNRRFSGPIQKLPIDPRPNNRSRNSLRAVSKHYKTMVNATPRISRKRSASPVGGAGVEWGRKVRRSVE